ncbi:hypothetical protein SDC9_50784 [bioreactor metagenome]|uniref:Uncharacterized protein n=1 Tax=bioreactor metagenome TaxID=1076179 RepID=A0A644WKU1_9ZZZZ
MVERGNQRNQRLPVGQRKHAHLFAGQELLNHNAVSACTENPFLHHGVNRFAGFLARLSNDHALAQRRAVRLDDAGIRRLVQIGVSAFGAVEHFVIRRRDAEFMHERFGKALASLYFGGGFAGAETANALCAEPVANAQNQRVVRADDGEVDFVFHRERDDFVNLGSADGHALRVRLHAAVAGQRVNLIDARVFAQFF